MSDHLDSLHLIHVSNLFRFTVSQAAGWDG